MTNEDILKAIQECAKKLGRTPRMRDIRALLGVSREYIAQRFGTFGKALKAAGLETSGAGLPSQRPNCFWIGRRSRASSIAFPRAMSTRSTENTAVAHSPRAMGSGRA
jgi:hypothetical protein